jgi:Tol biopolymer transport system component
MGKLVRALIVWLLITAVLAACGPTLTPVDTPEPGPPQPVADTPKVPSAPADCQGRLAFVGRDGDEIDIFVINADGSGLVNVTNADGTEVSPAWSPDGTRIAFSRHVGSSDIYTIRPDGSDEVQLTDLPSREYAPAWSPDGAQVLYASTAGYATELNVVGAGGGESLTLTSSIAHKPDFAWSPDGARIAFTMLDGYNQGDVFVMAAAHEMGASGDEATNLTGHPANDCCVDWAPGSQRLLFLSSRTKDSGRWRGYQFASTLIYAGPGSARTASSDAVRVFTTVLPDIPEDIYVINADGSGLTRLTSGRGRVVHAAWAPVGEAGQDRIAFVSDRKGNDDIYVMTIPDPADPDTSDWIRLTDNLEDDLLPTWSPDGSCLAFVSYRKGQTGLYVMNADGSGVSKLAGDLYGGYAPTWAP